MAIALIGILLAVAVRDLPDPVQWRSWYLAAVIVLSGVAVGAAGRMAITVISGSPPGDEPDLGDLART